MSTEVKTDSKRLKFSVSMSCGGCKNAVSGIVGKVPGVSKYDVNLEQQSLEVEGSVSKEQIAAALSKWAAAGKKTVTFVAEQAV